MERSEVQKLHIKMSKYQYGISLFLGLFSVLSFFICKHTVTPVYNEYYHMYLYDSNPIYNFFGIIPPIVSSIAILSLILRFIPDLIYRKHIFTESFAIKLFIDYFCRILLIVILIACFSYHN